MNHGEKRNRWLPAALYLVGAFMGYAILATACGPGLTATEKVHFLTENERLCNRPCLSGIVPGKTTESQLLDIIASSSPKQFDDLRTNSNPITGLRYSWHDRHSSFTAYSDVKSDQVRYTILQTSPDIPIETFIEVMGSPDLYSAKYGCGEQCGIRLYLFYERFGLFTASFIPLAIQEGEVCHFTIPSEAGIDEIFLIPALPVTEIESYLAPVFPDRFEHIQPWSGFELNAVVL